LIYVSIEYWFGWMV